jgi:hypothetical protein
VRKLSTIVSLPTVMRNAFERVDCRGLDQSSHASQLMPEGPRSDDGETTPMKKPVEELTTKPGAKPATRRERNKVIPGTPHMINPTGGLWLKVFPGDSFNNSEFTVVGHKWIPIKQPNQSNNKTKVPWPKYTPEAHQQLSFKLDSKIATRTNKDQRVICIIIQALVYAGGGEHISQFSVSTN